MSKGNRIRSKPRRNHRKRGIRLTDGLPARTGTSVFVSKRHRTRSVRRMTPEQITKNLELYMEGYFMQARYERQAEPTRGPGWYREHRGAK